MLTLDTAVDDNREEMTERVARSLGLDSYVGESVRNLWCYTVGIVTSVFFLLFLLLSSPPLSFTRSSRFSLPGCVASFVQHFLFTRGSFRIHLVFFLGPSNLPLQDSFPVSFCLWFSYVRSIVFSFGVFSLCQYHTRYVLWHFIFLLFLHHANCDSFDLLPHRQSVTTAVTTHFTSLWGARAMTEEVTLFGKLIPERRGFLTPNRRNFVIFV